LPMMLQPLQLEAQIMFSVKWLRHGNEAQPVEVEELVITNLDRIVALCKGNLYSKRLRHSVNMPDGFVVVDDSDIEVRRWFDTSGLAT
jgi:hypothetical protein